MPFALRRMYEPPEESDDTRILVDRLWPRPTAAKVARQTS
jgi:uncharacterized protein YeaO (DUF488 family)